MDGSAGVAAAAVGRAREVAAVGQDTGGVHGELAVGGPVAADGVEVLEREAQWIDLLMARGTGCKRGLRFELCGSIEQEAMQRAYQSARGSGIRQFQ